jgi:hypothetical protein
MYTENLVTRPAENASFCVHHGICLVTQNERTSTDNSGSEFAINPREFVRNPRLRFLERFQARPTEAQRRSRMKKVFAIIVSAALLTTGLVSCPSEKVTPPAETPPPTPPPEVVTTELILNGGFEAITTNWTLSTNSFRFTSPPTCVHSGVAFAAITGGRSGFATISQTINVPAQGTTALKYWVRIETDEKPGIAASNLVVRVNETIIKTLTTADSRREYNEYTYDLSALKGTSAIIKFTGTFNTLVSSAFCVDDVSAINSR